MSLEETIEPENRNGIDPGLRERAFQHLHRFVEEHGGKAGIRILLGYDPDLHGVYISQQKQNRAGERGKDVNLHDEDAYEFLKGIVLTDDDGVFCVDNGGRIQRTHARIDVDPYVAFGILRDDMPIYEKLNFKTQVGTGHTDLKTATKVMPNVEAMVVSKETSAVRAFVHGKTYSSPNPEEIEHYHVPVDLKITGNPPTPHEIVRGLLAFMDKIKRQ